MHQRRPAFAAAAIGTLALGIAANAIVFAVVKGVLIDPLPFAQPDRLVVLSSAPDTPWSRGMPGLEEVDFHTFAEANKHLETLATFGTWPVNTSGAGVA